jgi:3',5'-cyclic AMP phosphodiesterase CpdA
MKLLYLGCLSLLLASATAGARSIALVSDLNGRYGSDVYHARVDTAVAALVRLQPDLVISTGDMVAGQRLPHLLPAELDRMWAAFDLAVTDPLAQAGIPFAVTPGNHDGSAFPGFDRERERFDAQWRERRLPGLAPLPGSQWPRRYAARLDGVLLVAFDGTRPGRLPTSEYEFLRRMLEAHSPAAEATIVFSHLPLWPFARGREGEILDDPDLLALLHRTGVDVYASGHHHVFYAGVDRAGLVHLSVGALGGNARSFAGERARQPHGVALLDLASHSIAVRSLTAPAFDAPVPPEQLPPTVGGPLGQLRRLDGPAPLRP